MLPARQRDAADVLTGHLDRHDWRVAFDRAAHGDLLGLLEHHPNAAVKIGPGIACFFKVPSTWAAKPIVWLRRLDGGEDDFDLRRALSARSNPASPGLQTSPVYRAARRAVEGQIEAARRAGRLAAIEAGRAGLMRCSLTGTWHDERDFQVDHVGPAFTALIASWMIRRGLTLDRLKTVSTFPEPGRRFSDDALARDFDRFHAEKARLGLVWRAAHLARHCTPEGRKIALAAVLAAGVDPLADGVRPVGGGRVLQMPKIVPARRPAPSLLSFPNATSSAVR